MTMTSKYLIHSMKASACQLIISRWLNKVSTQLQVVDYLALISEAHVVGGENQLPQVIF